jgi:hypothetical protein
MSFKVISEHLIETAEEILFQELLKAPNFQSYNAYSEVRVRTNLVISKKGHDHVGSVSLLIIPVPAQWNVIGELHKSQFYGEDCHTATALTEKLSFDVFKATIPSEFRKQLEDEQNASAGQHDYEKFKLDRFKRLMQPQLNLLCNIAHDILQDDK